MALNFGVLMSNIYTEIFFYYTVWLVAHVHALTHYASLISDLGILFLDDIYKFCMHCQMYKISHNTSNSIISSMCTEVESVYLRFICHYQPYKSYKYII